MAIDQSFLDELTARSDIVDVVSRYVSLKKSGSNYFGLCPFHNEKSPSFSVSQDKQIFHCFGCGVGGGVISFIMRAEGLEFYDAVSFLAKQNGMTVPENNYDKKTSKIRERLLALMKDTARFYYSELWKPENINVQQYFAKRGLTRKTMNRFGLGFAPNSFFATMDAMKEKGYTQDELLACGLVAKSEKGNLYDKFRNRVMFPIFDLRGNVIAFGGRVMDDSKPKYLNSPETAIFHKSRNLFAIEKARKTANDYFILAEGYMDVIALHQAGFDSAVASLGTALTEEQARLIARYTKNIIISYDADNAGQMAAQRAIDILKKSGLNVRVLRIPNAKDPDQFIKEKGSDAFRRLIEQSSDDIAYKINNIASKFDLEEDQDRISFLKEAAYILALIDSDIEREIYTTRVANMAKISPQSMTVEVKNALQKRNQSLKKEKRREVRSVTQNAQPKDKSFKYENITSARSEEGILSVIFGDNTLVSYLNGKISPDDFTSPILKAFFIHALELYNNNKNITIPAFEGHFEPEALSLLTTITSRPVPAMREKALDDYINKIKSCKLKQSDSTTDPLLALAKAKKEKNFGGNRI